MIALHSKDINQAFHRELRLWIKALIYTGGLFAILFFCQQVFAADGTEFSDASGKLEKWVKGNLGKVAAFGTLIIGLFYAGWKRDYSALWGAVILAMAVGIIVGIINSSFTATI